MRTGSYVTAKLVGKDDCRQSVFIGHDGAGNAFVQGETQSEPYVCERQMVVVPDRMTFQPSTKAHIASVRAQLRQLGAG